MESVTDVKGNSTLAVIERSVKLRAHGEQAGAAWAQLAEGEDIAKAIEIKSCWMPGRGSVAGWVREYIGDVVPGRDEIAARFGGDGTLDEDVFAFGFLDAVVAHVEDAT